MGALTGLKILDFSTLLPGPYATLVMADMGAEVVSIAAPGRKDILTGRQHRRAGPSGHPDGVAAGDRRYRRDGRFRMDPPQ